MYTENPTDISEEGEHGLSKHSYIDPTWKIKDQRKKFRQVGKICSVPQCLSFCYYLS